MILNLSDFLPLLSAFTNLKRQYEIKFKEIRKVFYMFMFPKTKKVSEKPKNCTLYKWFHYISCFKSGFSEPQDIEKFSNLVEIKWNPFYWNVFPSRFFKNYFIEIKETISRPHRFCWRYFVWYFTTWSEQYFYEEWCIHQQIIVLYIYCIIFIKLF